MSVKMYLSWRTKQRKFSPLGAKHHFLLLFCPPVRLHLDPRLHKREMGLFVEHPERNLRTRAISAAFPPRTCKFCCFKYNLNLCAVSELTWSSLFQSMFGRVILSEKYKATYSIGSKTNLSKSRRKMEDKRKARKRSSLAVENRKSRASVIFLSLAGTPVVGEYEPEK